MAACLALAPNAGAAIYWGNSGAIGGAQLDGSLADQAFIPAQGPGGVAVDSQHIYWTNFGGTTIGRANRDGSGANQSFITTNGPAFGVAVDGGHVYWANNTTGSIGRANLDGSAVDNNFVPGATDPEGVAVDGQHVYWGNGRDANGTVARANLDGGGVNTSFVTGADGATGVALDGTHIFWSSTNHNSIGRVNLDGVTGKNLNFIPDPIAFNTEGVAVFGGFIYFTTGNDPAAPGTIGRANVDGSNATRNFITTAAPWPFGVAVDGAAFTHPASPGGGGTNTGKAASPLKTTPKTAKVTKAGLVFKLTCTTDCTVSVSGELAYGKAKKKTSKTKKATAAASKRLRTTKVKLKAGKAKTVVVKLSKDQRKAIKKAKKKKRKITAKLKLKVTPKGGKATTKSVKLKVK